VKKILLFLCFLLVAGGLSDLRAQHCSQPIVVGGTNTYCSGNNSGFVFVDNRTDSLTIIRWESALSPTGPFSLTGAPATDTLNFSNLTQTTYYQAYVRRSGCSEAYTSTIIVSIDQPSIAGTLQGTASACERFLSGNLTLSGQRGNITGWQSQIDGQSGWANFGTTANPQPISNIEQTTQFRAVVQNGVCSADTSMPVTISIFPNPVANFNFNSVCLGDSIRFFDASTGSINNYSWIMGDGSVSSQRNPIKRYLQPGVYDVTLTVTTNQNCRNDITKQVEVYYLPVADFSAAEVCVHDSTVFRNLSSSLSGAITYWSWNFADLTPPSLEREPKHLFAQAGEYRVSLFIRTEYDCRHSVQRTVIVNQKPRAVFSADTVCLGNMTSFYNLSFVETGYILRNQWNFGDGTSTQQPYPNKTYQTAGEFSVRLIVESEKQCKDTTTGLVRVRALPIADFSVIEVCDGETTLFQNNSSTADDEITHHQWNFGDGSTSNEHTPTKLYLNPETYSVSLLVRTAFGCEHQTQRQAIVHRNPIADFFVQNVCLGERAEFVNQSFIRSNETLYYEWDLGDGNQNQFNSFFHVFEHFGDHTISLKVTSSRGGCLDSIKRTFRVYPLPNINAGEDLTTGRGIPVQLSASGGIRYQWFPTIGLSNSTIANPVATLGADQTYIVYGTDAFGCENSDTVRVFIIDDQRIVPTNFVSPNSGGGNSYWVIQNIEHYPEARVTIFDISGVQVFSTTNYQNNWDGRNQNGEALPDGTYYYIVTFPKDNRTYKGAILVLRKK
jgi:gliding motility-associated-like protein